MQQLVPTIVYVLAFISVVLASQAAGGLLLGARDRRARVNRRLALLDSGMPREAVYAALVRQEGLNKGRFGLSRIEARIGDYLRQANLDMSARRFLAFVAGAAALLWIVSVALVRAPGAATVLNSVGALIAAFVFVGAGAWVYLTNRREKRLKQIDDQLPLALDVINRALRAGHPVISAVQLAAEELGDPLGSEFGLIVDETTYGVEFPEALHNFARRTGSKDASFFAICVSIQAQTGGNLAEILEGLATVVRGRNTLGKRVKALASEGRASAALLSALPVLMIGAMFMMQPTFYTSKFSDPIFWPVVGVVAFDYLTGLVTIRRIINFKY